MLAKSLWEEHRLTMTPANFYQWNDAEEGKENMKIKIYKR